MKNKIIVFIAVAAVLTVGYFAFIKKKLPADVVDLSPFVEPSEKDDIELSVSNVDNINRILQENKNKNLKIQLPKGRIWISKPIIIPSNSTIQGHDKGSEIWVSKKTSEVNLGYIVNENSYMGDSLSDNNITLLNFTINGNNVILANSNVNERGLFLNKVSDVIINGVTVLNTEQEAIRVNNSSQSYESKNIVITNCKISKSSPITQCIMISSYASDPRNSANTPSKIFDVKISKNNLTGGNHGIALINCTDVELSDNACLNNSQRGINISSCKDTDVIKNTIKNAGSTGIIAGYGCKNVLIDSNSATGTKADMGGKGFEGQGIKAYYGFENITITNNLCTDNITDGIAVEGGDKGIGFIVENNICEGNKRDGIHILAGALYEELIYSETTLENGVIKNNKLSGNLGVPLYMGGGEKLINVIEDNNIV